MPRIVWNQVTSSTLEISAILESNHIAFYQTENEQHRIGSSRAWARKTQSDLPPSPGRLTEALPLSRGSQAKSVDGHKSAAVSRRRCLLGPYQDAFVWGSLNCNPVPTLSSEFGFQILVCSYSLLGILSPITELAASCGKGFPGSLVVLI